MVVKTNSLSLADIGKTLNKRPCEVYFISQLKGTKLEKYFPPIPSISNKCGQHIEFSGEALEMFRVIFNKIAEDKMLRRIYQRWWEEKYDDKVGLY